MWKYEDGFTKMYPRIEGESVKKLNKVTVENRVLEGFLEWAVCNIIIIRNASFFFLTVLLCCEKQWFRSLYFSICSLVIRISPFFFAFLSLSYSFSLYLSSPPLVLSLTTLFSTTFSLFFLPYFLFMFFEMLIIMILFLKVLKIWMQLSVKVWWYYLISWNLWTRYFFSFYCSVRH